MELFEKAAQVFSKIMQYDALREALQVSMGNSVQNELFLFKQYERAQQVQHTT